MTVVESNSLTLTSESFRFQMSKAQAASRPKRAFSFGATLPIP